jgi:hypothetical protein
MDSVKKETVKENLTFSNKLLGEVSINRKKLIASLENEHRSYANHSFAIGDTKSFTLPELQEQYPSGFSLGVVIHLKDNANGEKKGSKLVL